MTDPGLMAATREAAKLVAALQAGDSDGSCGVLHRAKSAGTALDLAIALAVRCAQIATELYGDRVQVELDGWALDAMWFEEREAMKREVDRYDDSRT